MKIKTSKLTGAALDWAVAKANDYLSDETVVARAGRLYTYDERSNHMDEEWKPSESWAQAGHIIEREKLGVTFEAGWEVPRWSAWGAGVDEPRTETYAGDTPLEAAMRCFVASKLGDEVEVPEELR